MHPEIERDEPGACPICGMDLEPKFVQAAEESDGDLRVMSRRFWISVFLSAPLLVIAMAPKWTIPEFRHPSPRSTDCVQCHQAPPSHYMEHFHMVSARVAGKPHAQVSQCYQCHQTTSWNDIRGVGWYKHH
jgi:hypothetical protein